MPASTTRPIRGHASGGEETSREALRLALRMTRDDLFAGQQRVEIAEGAVLLPGRALVEAAELLAGVEKIVVAAPLRRMVTPGGLTMSVAMTNCGECGWVTDRKGYRYVTRDPCSDRPWPAMPAVFARLARAAAASAGFDAFEPDACLVNEYLPGSKLSLHQDRDEASFDWPIVSVSLGVSATFQFGGLRRQDRTARLSLQHGDVFVWGGAARLRYHGVLPLKSGPHPLLGARRLNLTFRRAR